MSHTITQNTRILLVNLGTPESATTASVRRFLTEFLSDRRVVNLPWWLWQPILRGIILPLRAPKSAHAYQQIWTPRGSPLLCFTRDLAVKMQQQCTALGLPYSVDFAMRYGKPSIADVLATYHQQPDERIIVIPLYPQFSTTTTLSVIDAVNDAVAHLQLPSPYYLEHYYDAPGYINSLATSIQHYWQQHERAPMVVFSFHGLPQQVVDAGDPYQTQCYKTATLLANAVGLSANEYRITFQSRFGRAAWLQPYTDVTLQKLAQQGVSYIQVVCPGFAVDCLETLEEIAIQNRELFIAAGGSRFDYIPALNAGEMHAAMLLELVETLLIS